MILEIDRLGSAGCWMPEGKEARRQKNCSLVEGGVRATEVVCFVKKEFSPRRDLCFTVFY